MQIRGRPIERQLPDFRALTPAEMRRWMKVVEDASGFPPNRIRFSDGEYYLTKRGTIGRRIRANP